MRRAMAAFVLVLTFLLPAHAQDGSYSGTRHSESSDSRCNATTLSGTVAGKNVQVTLAYNGVVLSGVVGGGGALSLRGASSYYSYYFSGTLKNGTMRGSWHAQPRYCWGTWSLTRSK